MTGAPSVSLSSPKVNAAYYTSTSTSVQVSATASDIDGNIKKVDFYTGSTLIKTLTLSPYLWTWSNVAAGTYTLTAKATDNDGNVTTSAPISITVSKSTTAATTANSTAMETMDTTAVTSETPGKENITQPAFDFRLYPNPAVNKIFIALNSESLTNGKGIMTIQNLSGNLLQRKEIPLSNSQVEVDVSSFSSGMYIITITTDKTFISRKFLKAN